MREGSKKKKNVVRTPCAFSMIVKRKKLVIIYPILVIDNINLLTTRKIWHVDGIIKSIVISGFLTKDASDVIC